MQEIEFATGRVVRRFGVGDARAAHEATLRDLKEQMDAGLVKKVKTVEVDESRLCPCGSGRRFRFCCLNKLGKDPEEVTLPTDAQRLQRHLDDQRFDRDQLQVLMNRRRVNRRGRGPDGSGKLGGQYLRKLQGL